jgi:5'-3' exonuclease
VAIFQSHPDTTSTREENFNLEPSKKRPPDSSFSTEPTTRKKPRLDSRTVTLTVEPQADPSNREIFDYELDERQADSSSSNRFVFKKRYYESKFGQPLTDEVLSHIIQEYAKGLGWILSYYFQVDCDYPIEVFF